MEGEGWGQPPQAPCHPLSPHRPQHHLLAACQTSTPVLGPKSILCSAARKILKPKLDPAMKSNCPSRKLTLPCTDPQGPGRPPGPRPPCCLCSKVTFPKSPSPSSIFGVLGFEPSGLYHQCSATEPHLQPLPYLRQTFIFLSPSFSLSIKYHAKPCTL